MHCLLMRCLRSRYVGLRSSASGGSYGADEARRLGLSASDVAEVEFATRSSVAMSRFGGVTLVPLLFFYDKTHICLAEHYRKFVLSYRNSGAAIKPGMFIGERLPQIIPTLKAVASYHLQ
jgi:hypothetical protein